MLRPWDLNIRVVRSAQTAIYLQICQAILEEIRRGRIKPGAALPGTRELAESLGVNRKTVVEAYDELTAQGWLVPERTRGTFVSAELPDIGRLENRNGGKAGMPDRPDFRLRGTGPGLSLVFASDGVLTFDDGAPDTRLIPVDELARAYRSGLGLASRRNRLGYGDPRGSLALREAVSTMLNADRGLTTTPENICLVRGSQMGIYLAARILVGPGDTVAVEELSYPPAREAFRATGAEVAAVGLDGHGMRVDELEKLCRRQRVRAVYVTPHHQFPTTVLMKPERRLRLMALAEQFGFAIVEDDYDHEFHFVHRPMLPLASADRGGKVIYIGSMSKLLSPSLRIGYIAAPVPVVDRAAAEITIIDRQGDPATETAVADLMESGAIKRHTRRVMRVYAERRELLGDLLLKAFGDLVSFTLPEGGLALWVQFNDGIDLAALADKAGAEGLRFLPGQSFAASAQPVQAVRLGFGSLDASELAEAVRRFARLVRGKNA